jgi:hypothetical protein
VLKEQPSEPLKPLVSGKPSPKRKGVSLTIKIHPPLAPQPLSEESISDDESDQIPSKLSESEKPLSEEEEELPT